MTLASGFFLDRHGFAGHHRFIDRAAALDDDAIDRHVVAGAHAQAVADMHLLQRDFFVAAIVADPPRGFGCEIEQRADGAAGLLARAQFQHLPEQDEHRDDRCRFEIDRDDAVASASSAGKSPGANVAARL